MSEERTPRPPSATDRDRTDIWLPLLRRLSEEIPNWLVYKGVDSAFTGIGDIDSVAPGEDWPAITAIFKDWAIQQGLGPVVVCPHVPNVLHLVALDPNSPYFFEMDVNRRKVFLGSTLFMPPDLLPLAVDDERGFRRLRPGVEGLMKLVQNGARRGGRSNWEGIRTKKIVELLNRDPEGVERGARLFGRGASAVEELAEAVTSGEWNRSAMLRVEGWCLIGSVREPSAIWLRLRFRRVRGSCPVLVTVFERGRAVPNDREAWLAEVRADHTVDDTSVGD